MNIFTVRPKVIPDLDIDLIYIPFLKELDHIKILFPINRIIVYGYDKKDRNITVAAAYDTKELIKYISDININDLDPQYIDPEYKCPECKSRETRVVNVNINISNNFTITRASIRCLNCKQTKIYDFSNSPIHIPYTDIIKQKYNKFISEHKMTRYYIYLASTGHVILYGQDINTKHRLKFVLFRYDNYNYNKILRRIYSRCKSETNDKA
jgi:hypothetical protein